jgi:hypothetical protein
VRANHQGKVEKSLELLHGGLTLMTGDFGSAILATLLAQ